MTRVKLLCAIDRTMLQIFSRRTVESLKRYTLFKLLLPAFQTFLDINVGKEVEKDRMVITRAGELYQSGTSPSPDHVTTLLKKAQDIDQIFLRDTALFPINIRIRYQDIESYRQKRFELLLHTSHHILNQWQYANSIRAAVSELYNEAQFRGLLHDMLSLYAMETRMLSRSVHIPHLLALARESVTQIIGSVMEQEAKVLAKALARTIYQR